jgi:triphosphatase
MPAKVLAKTWKKSAKYGREIERLNGERRHEMRKALKKLRYQTEFLAPLFKRDTEQFIKQLKALQDVFGYINDVRVASRLTDLRKEYHGSVDTIKAASYIVGWHEAEANHVWRQAGKAWKALESSRRFWR